MCSHQALSCNAMLDTIADRLRLIDAGQSSHCVGRVV